MPRKTGNGIASEILNGKRGLSQRHIRILADRFKAEAGLFIGLRSPKASVGPAL